ncbi:MAG: hypothetical protein ACLSB9_18830 [Hydrogeniiclostridium mannosilyticum]
MPHFKSLTVIGLIPTTVLLYTIGGTDRILLYGDYYVSADGNYYYSASSYSFLVYDSDGNTSVQPFLPEMPERNI